MAVAGRSVIAIQKDRQANPATLSMATMLQSYKKNEAPKFNDTLADYREQTEKQIPAETGRSGCRSRFSTISSRSTSVRSVRRGLPAGLPRRGSAGRGH